MNARSMVDQDTDRWLFEVLAPDIRRRMEDDKHDVQWTDLVYGKKDLCLLPYC